MRLSALQIERARKQLALGRSLESAAAIAGISAPDLDRALWDRLARISQKSNKSGASNAA